MSHIDQPSVSNCTRRLIKTPYRSRPLHCQHLRQPQIVVITFLQRLQITYLYIVTWSPITCVMLCELLQVPELLRLSAFWGGSLQICDKQEQECARQNSNILMETKFESLGKGGNARGIQSWYWMKCGSLYTWQTVSKVKQIGTIELKVMREEYRSGEKGEQIVLDKAD
jgi:hypothetical protein